MKITSKAQFFTLWEQGVLGNRTNLWHDPFKAWDSNTPYIGFRQIGVNGGGAWEKVPRVLLFQTYNKWKDSGYNFIMDDGAPHDKATIQGEICRTFRGLEGYIDTSSQLPMRRAAAAGYLHHYTGSEILVLLNTFMDPSSQDDVRELLDLYPDATIEFTCFSINVGVFPHRNTLIWEVRCY